MPRNGSGAMSLTSADNPNVAGAVIQAAKMNNTLNDIATALTESICRDGQTTITANLPMSGYKHTGAADGSALTDYASIKNVQNGTPLWCSVGGTGDAITLSPAPAITAYVAGQEFHFTSSATNTTTVTVAISGLTTKAIQATGTALSANDILSGKTYSIIYDGTAFQLSSASNATINGATLVSPTITGTPVIPRIKSVLNLMIQNDATLPYTTLNISADSLATQNYLLTSVAVNALITASGANGLDTGIEAASTWYYVFVIYNPTTTTKAGLLSIFRTAPTLPSGYTEWIRVGSVRNDPSSNFILFDQIDNKINYQSFAQNNIVPTTGSNVSKTAISLSASVPPQSVQSDLYISGGVTSSIAGSIYCVIYNKSGSISSVIFGLTPLFANIVGASSQISTCVTDSSQNLSYQVFIKGTYSGGGFAIYVAGYYDPLN